MSLPGWSAWAIAGGLLAAALVWFLADVVRTYRYDKSFQPLGVGLWTYVNFGPGLDIVRLRQAILLATTSIAATGPFTSEQLFLLPRLAPAARIHIMATNIWKNSAGQMVGGELLGSTLVIGPDLSALCHELIHLLRMLASHGADVDGGRMPNGGLGHPEWIANGLNAADAAYRKALAVR